VITVLLLTLAPPLNVSAVAIDAIAHKERMNNFFISVKYCEGI
jgi:hypothetical protein